ncbi:MAG: pyruvate:ferredoxin (flavodoxin) oxidoreductase [Anaerolineae bacterium]|nr:pyruvate:ferredoxin (flavodoxin) oxidoreductase [Anaerolineae bacterium]
MAERKMVMVDGNTACTYVAHKINEVIAIYPITPSTSMGEMADAFSSAGQTNIWGTVPLVVEMQSEGGAAAAVHGALQTGALTTTFTASQGLMLMIPSMFKIAGELTSLVIHVSARSLAMQALSIFGDHSDVMAVRSTGFGLLSSCSVQEAHDFALISQAATLEARVPFIHFFDGFRTSNEINKIEQLTREDLQAMIDDDLVREHRARAMNPDKPIVRGTSQGPDVYFQGRETVNPFYVKTPGIVQKAMDKFAKLVGRQYHLFDYVGAPDAEHVIVMMGSGAEVAHETVEYLTGKGEKIGLLKVRLYRPFDVQAFAAALPKSVKLLAVLDRTKEPGAIGEPLYEDCITALTEAGRQGIQVIGGRYGLSSKEFTPAMVKGIFDEMKKKSPKNHFTVGINDDVTNSSIAYDASFNIEPPDVVRALFYGLGSDGTVGANHDTIEIIGMETPNYAQGYFAYDAKKSGGYTVSHLRFGPRPIRQTCQVNSASFIGCHQFVYLEKLDVLGPATVGGTFLLNTPYDPNETWDKMPRHIQQQIIDKKLKFYAINAYDVAVKAGMPGRINTIMQTCFFALSGVLPKDEAIAKIKEAIHKRFIKKGEKVVQMNYAAVDNALAHLVEIKVPDKATSTVEVPPIMASGGPEFVYEVAAKIATLTGNAVPVSAMPVDGTVPTGTTQYEKRSIALEMPVWNPDVCIQCGKCAMACPHAVIRMKIYDPALLDKAPEGFQSADAKGKKFEGKKFTIQAAPEDCTGCGLCVETCPAQDKQNEGRKAINMTPQPAIRAQQREYWNFFFNELPDYDRSDVNLNTVKETQLLRPLFEFSGACGGCGETPYVRLVTQLFGDRAVISNATGCSSIYGGHMPTTPYTTNADGRGPTWNNSLFEDNAEFGFGFRLTLDKQQQYARELVEQFREKLGGELADGILSASQVTESDYAAQRERVAQLKSRLAGDNSPKAKDLLSLADVLVRRCVWVFGGDGWAYDIGYGGLDHVLAQGRDINVLVLDTQLYSNTGGQMSKATPRGAVAKFAAAGRPLPKKDLGLISMTYGNIYVAQIAMGADDAQALKAIREAESYEGPSLVIAYAHCINQGLPNMKYGFEQQKKAVASGAWTLYRYDPRLAAEGKNPLQLDYAPHRREDKPQLDIKEYMYNEVRFKTLAQSKPEIAAQLLELARQDAIARWKYYKQLAGLDFSL